MKKVKQIFNILGICFLVILCYRNVTGIGEAETVPAQETEQAEDTYIPSNFVVTEDLSSILKQRVAEHKVSRYNSEDELLKDLELFKNMEEEGFLEGEDAYINVKLAYSEDIRVLRVYHKYLLTSKNLDILILSSSFIKAFSYSNKNEIKQYLKQEIIPILQNITFDTSYSMKLRSNCAGTLWFLGKRENLKPILFEAADSGITDFMYMVLIYKGKIYGSWEVIAFLEKILKNCKNDSSRMSAALILIESGAQDKVIPFLNDIEEISVHSNERIARRTAKNILDRLKR